MADDKKINKNKLSSRIHRAEQCLLAGNVISLTENDITRQKIQANLNLYACENKHHFSLGTRPDIVEETIGTTFVGSGMQEFMDLDEEEISYLAPRIRLFRVQSAKEAAIQKTNSNIKNLQNKNKQQASEYKKSKIIQSDKATKKFYNRKLKMDTKERKDEINKNKKRLKKLKSSDEILEFKFENFQNNEDINNIITGKRDRVQEAGIVSCNWRLMGKNPVEAERQVDVEIKFFFSSIETLLSNGAPGTNAPNYLDLIPDFKRSDDFQYDVLLSVGYEVPDKNFQTIVGSKQRYEKIINAIKMSNKVLNLKFTTQDIEFDQTGMIYMTIRYIGYMEERLSKILLFKDLGPSKYQQVQSEYIKENEKKAYNAKVKSIAQTILKAYRKFSPPKTLSTWQRFKGALGYDWNLKETEDKYRRYQKVLNKMETVVNADLAINLSAKIDTLKLINQEIYKLKTAGSTKKGALTSEKGLQSGVKEITIKTQELAHVIGLSDLKQFFEKEDIKKLLNKRSYKYYLSSLKQEESGLVPSYSSNSAIKGLVDNLGDLSKNISKGKQRTNKKELKKSLNKIISKTSIQNADASKQKYTIEYTTLGAIFDAFIEVCLNSKVNIAKKPEINNFLERSRFVFGNIRMLSYQRDGSSKEVIVSLNDFPVSVKYFNAWFLNTIVDGGSKSLSLLRAFNSFVSKLVVSSVGSSCFRNQDTDFKSFPRNSISVSSHFINSDLDPFTYQMGKQKLSELPTDEKRLGGPFFLKMIRKYDQERLIYENYKSIFHYVIIGARNSFLSSRQQNIINDSKTGIFHFFLGRDNGLVKTINFSKADQKYLEEVNLTRENTNTRLETFRRIYNAQIELFGNSAFIPGQMIYINADSISKNSNIALDLGLGGYFVITEVSNSFEGGAYNTSLKCIWVGFGRGGRLKYGSAGRQKGPSAADVFSELNTISNNVLKISKASKGKNKGTVIFTKNGVVLNAEGYREYLYEQFKKIYPDVDLK